MTTSTFDVVVIGAGPVGEVAADRARRGGLSVAIVERRLVGGECSFWACSPSKALLRPIHVTAASRRVRGSEGARLVPEEVLARRDAWIDDLDDSGQVAWVERAGITLVRGEASLVGERAVEVDGRRLTARHAVVLATGSDPAVPDLPGLRDARPWTNREATTSHTVPASLVVLGGGVAAVELAQVYSALGSKVTVVEQEDRLLSRLEPFAGERVRAALEAAGVRVLTGAGVEAVRRARPGGQVRVSLAGGREVRGAEVLCALGRVPATTGLGLPVVGARTDERGFVVVDDRMEVRGAVGERPWLYAVGDVNGIALLTHMGKYQARACGDLVVARARGRSEEAVRREPGLLAYATALGSPQVVFTDPEVASAGLTAAQAREAGLSVRVVDVPMDAAAGAGLVAEGYDGLARLVVDTDRQVVVGATFVGQDTAELAHAAAVAVVGEVPLDRLWHAVPSFPTMSEIWLRLLEAYGL